MAVNRQVAQADKDGGRSAGSSSGLTASHVGLLVSTDDAGGTANLACSTWLQKRHTPVTKSGVPAAEAYPVDCGKADVDSNKFSAWRMSRRRLLNVDWEPPLGTGK